MVDKFVATCGGGGGERGGGLRKGRWAEAKGGFGFPTFESAEDRASAASILLRDNTEWRGCVGMFELRNRDTDFGFRGEGEILQICSKSLQPKSTKNHTL